MLHCDATAAAIGRSAAGLLAALGILLTSQVHAAPSAGSSEVPVPTVTGPIEGGLRGSPWGGSAEGLEEADYVQEEYFFSGIAESRNIQGELDGRRAAEYTTRMLVRRPKNAEDFNGTVLMEWFNVTAEMEFAVLWGMAHPELLQRGYAYVGVSVQKVGVDASPLGLKFWDPIRYLPLRHPGDAYAFDMWSQAARALVARDGPAPLGNLRAKRILASGESQSAAYMVPYVKGVDPEHRTFDGFLIHSWPHHIDAPRVPVLMFLTETEKEGTTAPGSGQSFLSLGGLSAELVRFVPALGLLNLPDAAPPGPDNAHFRVWEIAGGSHYDRQALDYMSNVAAQDFLAPLPTPTVTLPLTCGLNSINRLGQERPVRAAVRALDRWVATGTAPASAPRLQQDDSGALVRDEDGLAVGGIRMPPMVAPVGVNEGKSCLFFGSFKKFGGAKIRERYPTAEDYRAQVDQAARKVVRRGWLLPEGADAYREEAAAVDAW